MVSKTAKKRSARGDHKVLSEIPWQKKYHSNEIWALLSGGFAVMLFLALYSFQPGDLPAGIPGIDGEPAPRNFVGPFGAVLAASLYFFGGVASYVIPAVLLWWTIQSLATKRSLTLRNFIALVVFSVSVACIVDCQTVFFQNWVERYDLPGSTGGIAGHFIGQSFFVRFFGPAGTFIIMIIISVLAFNLITGVHPIRFSRLLAGKISRFFDDRSRNQEEIYPVARALPVAETIHFEPVFSDAIAVECDAVPIQSSLPEMEVEKVAVVTPEPPVTPVPERVRTITNTSQSQHHHAASVPPPKPLKTRSPFAGKPQFESYHLPSLELLSYARDLDVAGTDDETLIQIQNHIVETLESFKVEVKAGDITRGPTVTRYEVLPSPGLRVNKIAALKDDIARATLAEKINILAPIPGKDTVGIEIANSNKVTVAIRELFESETFRDSNAKLPLVLGKDVYGKAIIGDLSRMPHLLVAGATGSGKSVCINSIIASLLYRFTPDELKFIMIDPKVVELQLYNSLPHMVVPVVTDPKKVILALRWVIKEMESRYAMFAKKGVRSFEGFNDLRDREIRGQEMAEQKVLQPNLFNTETGEDFLMGDDFGDYVNPAPQSTSDEEEMPEQLPYIVVIIDELADLMQTAPADVETSIARIAQKARAAGIHLVIATQTPRADVITGTIKANIPCRIAFQVSSKTDSRIILDVNGAENLVGKGDMLYLPPGSAQVIRAQGALITDHEAQTLVNACAAQGEPQFEAGDEDSIGFGFIEEEAENQVSDADEEVISKCMEVIFTEKKASTSLLQRKLRLGYTRAARMIDILESRGIVGPGDGAKPREILIDLS